MRLARARDSMNAAALRRQAWWNVWVGLAIWALIVVMPAALMPTIYGPIMDDTGWTRGEVVSFSSFKFAAGAAIAFFLGHIIERFGLSRVMLISMAGTGLSLASLLFARSLWAYYLAASVLGAAILGCITSMKVLISRWFSARLGFAIGVALTGAGIAGLVVPITATRMTQWIGWRLTALVLSSTIFIILIPLYLWKARASPAELGVTAEDIDPAPGGTAAATPDSSGPTFRELLRMRAFWAVLAAQTIVGAVDHGMEDHLPLFLARDAHLGADIAAYGFSITIVVGALGKLGFGRLFDRYSVRAVSFCWFAMAIGVALAFPVAGLLSFIIFTVVRGLTHGGTLVDIPICAKHVFGSRALAKTIAVFGAANSLGGALGTGAVGFAHDASGSYTASFVVLSALAVLAAAIIIRVAPRYWVGYGQRQSTKPSPVPVPASER